MSAPSPVSTREPPSTVMWRPEVLPACWAAGHCPASTLPCATSFKSPFSLMDASVSYWMLLLKHLECSPLECSMVGEFQALLASSFMPPPSCTVEEPASTRLAPMMATPPDELESGVRIQVALPGDAHPVLGENIHANARLSWRALSRTGCASFPETSRQTASFMLPAWPSAPIGILWTSARTGRHCSV